MHLSRLQLTNFRNFQQIDVALSKNCVIVGENKNGKSNLLFALRLILDPALPDSARALRAEDFWDGLPRPLKKTDEISISIEFSDFEEDENLLAVLGEHLISSKPMVSRLSYVWQPKADIENPETDADYEFQVFGGDRPANYVGYQLRRRIPLELIPALRDCESDLLRWSRSPLRPLLDVASSKIPKNDLKKLGLAIDAATEALTELPQVEEISDAIDDELQSMVGANQSLDSVLRFASTDSDKLIRSLRIFIDGGKRGISEASLGSANVLYFALKNLEQELLWDEDERDHTILAIEEPEAHLHPTLQRLIFRNYLQEREDAADTKDLSTILLTTHSPHVASVAPIRQLLLLRRDANANATTARSTAKIDIDDNEADDLERYIEATRGEILFARGVILVEGDAEKFLVPSLALNLGYELDELGLVVCSISGTNFSPYLKLLGPKGLDVPFAALTDLDPRPAKPDGTAQAPFGHSRVLNQMLPALSDDKPPSDIGKAIASAADRGIFVNSHTFEIDLFLAGLEAEFKQAMSDLALSKPMKGRMDGWAADTSSLDKDTFLTDLDAVGKGRFAQRLSTKILASESANCPLYIQSALKYLEKKCAPK